MAERNEDFTGTVWLLRRPPERESALLLLFLFSLTFFFHLPLLPPSIPRALLFEKDLPRPRITSWARSRRGYLSTLREYAKDFRENHTTRSKILTCTRLRNNRHGKWKTMNRGENYFYHTSRAAINHRWSSSGGESAVEKLSRRRAKLFSRYTVMFRVVLSNECHRNNSNSCDQKQKEKTLSFKKKKTPKKMSLMI